MPKHSTLPALLVLLVIGSFTFAPLSAHAQIIPDCNPSLFPNANTLRSPDGVDQTTPCGIYAFGLLLQNIIKYLILIVVPIAFLIIGWAGFKILTAAGNAERMNEGWGMIKVALTGILILALSFLIIRAVFNAIGAKEEILPQPSATTQ